MQALSTMRDFQEKMLEKLSEMTMTPTSQLRFLLDAWLQARSSAPHHVPGVRLALRPACSGKLLLWARGQRGISGVTPRRPSAWVLR